MMRYEMEMILAADELGNSKFLGFPVLVANSSNYLAAKYGKDKESCFRLLMKLVEKRMNHLSAIEARIEAMYE